MVVQLVSTAIYYYSVHQAWWALEYNIFFSLNYDFPFPINMINIFVDAFLLTVHEAGHTFASILGWRTFTILNGSLFQLFIPALILAYFWFNNIKVGMQLSWYLLGFSFIDVSFYIADAQLRQLPLIGNLPKSAHDWYNLLYGWGALEMDHGIAVATCILGVICYGAALIIPLFYKSYKQANIDLNL